MIRCSLLSLYIIIAAFSCLAQQYGSFTDPRDGRAYKTVKIGNQIWMAENLNVESFNNGDLIQEARTDEEWMAAINERRPAWCYYKNDSTNGNRYGRLYNWYAVSDVRRLNPKGWIIPSDIDWKSLIAFLGGATAAVDKMKSRTDWDEYNKYDYNLFSAKPSGARDGNGDFIPSVIGGCWWSIQSSEGKAFYIMKDQNKVGEGKPTIWEGYSIRCIKE